MSNSDMIAIGSAIVAILALTVSGIGIWYTRTQVQYLKKQFQIDYQPSIRIAISLMRYKGRDVAFLITLGNPSVNLSVEVTGCAIYFFSTLERRLYHSATIGPINPQAQQVTLVGLDKDINVVPPIAASFTDVGAGIEAFIQQRFADIAPNMDQTYPIQVIVKYRLEALDKSNDVLEKSMLYTLVRRQDGWELQSQAGLIEKEQRGGLYVA